MRRKMVVANRKMNGSIPENESFMKALLEGTKDFNNADFVVCLPY
jgi:triosephosphate isomerase